MLKGVDPILTADLLYVLRKMGHGDELVIADVNFPATSTANATPMARPVIELAGCDAVDALAAITSVFPLDMFVEHSAFHMVPSPGSTLPELAVEVHTLANEAIARSSTGASTEPLERFAFYERAKKAFAVVQVGAERRPYGCFILKKGVVGPDGKDLRP